MTLGHDLATGALAWWILHCMSDCMTQALPDWLSGELIVKQWQVVLGFDHQL